MDPSKIKPAWARIPQYGGVCCAICGKPIHPEDEYEATKTKRKSTLFFHKKCLKEAHLNG